MVTKDLLNAFHDFVKWIAHIVLIPAMAALDASIAGLTRLKDELSKV